MSTILSFSLQNYNPGLTKWIKLLVKHIWFLAIMNSIPGFGSVIRWKKKQIFYENFSIFEWNLKWDQNCVHVYFLFMYFPSIVSVIIKQELIVIRVVDTILLVTPNIFEVLGFKIYKLSLPAGHYLTFHAYINTLSSGDQHCLQLSQLQIPTRVKPEMKNPEQSTHCGYQMFDRLQSQIFALL